MIKSSLSLILAAAFLMPVLPADAKSEAKPETKAEMSPADRRRMQDPSSDRNIVLPSAETIPKGKMTFNSYELLGLGCSYGLTDNLQLSLVVTPIATPTINRIDPAMRRNIRKA